MNIKKFKYIFLIGKPGSGKSTAAKIIKNQIKKTKNAKKTVCILDDYLFLQQWQHLPENKIKFKEIEYGGFQVLDFSILNDVLVHLDQLIVKNSSKFDHIIIEFSRNSYATAFSFFSPLIIDQACILYIDSTLEICIERNELRKFQNYVPEVILREYYSSDDMKSIQKKFGLKLQIIPNNYKEMSEFYSKLINKLLI
jgi:tRNA uridine 5-carbamoylmethylation protein Kti12